MSKLLVEVKLGPRAELFNVKYQTKNKFYRDNINIDTDQYRIILDGVFVNRLDLCTHYRKEQWSEVINELVNHYGLTFHERLRGSYYGLIYDKQRSEWCFFGDEINSKPLFYYQSKDFVLMGNNIFDMVSHIKSKGDSVSISIPSCYDLLTRGFMVESNTIVSEINRLRTGFRLRGSNDLAYTECYYKISLKSDNSIKMSDAVEIVDDLFLKAIDRNFKLDDDYRFKHIASLSGGLDSRMTVMMAHKMGYDDQLNFTFAQSGTLDSEIASQIASDLNHEWIFQFLDNGNFLKNLDQTTQVSQGLALYFGFSHGYSMIKNINLDNYGVVHTGQVGDAVIGSFMNTPTGQDRIDPNGGGHSLAFLEKQSLMDLNFYENQEHFMIYNRALGAANMGSNVYYQYTESLSPFLDHDFLSSLYNIPLSLRYDHRLYKKWILTKHPECARYIWEGIGCRIDSPMARRLSIGKYSIIWNRIPAFVLRGLRVQPDKWNDKTHMNPIGYYYSHNDSLRKWMNSYVNESIDLLDFDKELKHDCLRLFNSGNCLEKNLTLSLLGMIKAIDKC
ncbi:hypothetical protein K5X82_18610 [Halosquirtibacter xylanolyticus]|uniref:hypothetical protein n=1 Tax=Halosquirtibacter xylanolyticus TaxID=3374599 RepID=UPI0037485021|nr:hypothetical protein K5X82_18610 [Prolixibacteraceae bacterium]